MIFRISIETGSTGSGFPLAGLIRTPGKYTLTVRGVAWDEKMMYLSFRERVHGNKIVILSR